MAVDTDGSAAADRSALASFFPGYFALVMATGIVSLAAHCHGLAIVSVGLLAVNLAAYAILWLITLLRLWYYPRELLADLTHHGRGVSFLTMVAGTCVLGSQVAVLTPYLEIAAILWLAGIGLWLVLNYTFFASVTLVRSKPALPEGINGAWLLVTVATESIGVLGVLVAPAMAVPEAVLFAALCAHLLGAMFYILFIGLILYRWMFFCMEAAKVTPPYWINMGALAITTLSGARLLLASGEWDLLIELRPFLTGLTLLSWATASWWIPLLVLIGIWRHGFEAVPIRYDPQYWALVFPLGMYSVATHYFGQAIGVGFLNALSAVFVWIALAAWLTTFFGLLATLARGGWRS